MRIARYMIKGRPTVAVDAGHGFQDYGAILEKQGIRSEIAGSEPERRLIKMLKRGLLDPEFMKEQIAWARRTGQQVELDVDNLTPLLPLRPAKFVCMARNWKAHAREGGHELPDRPIFFVKTENCAVGPGEPIKLPTGIGRVDHEGELGLVIRRKASAIKAADINKYVLGYTIVNDVTARQAQHALAKDGYPWYQAKSIDTFAPMGPWIVTFDEMEPLAGKRIKVSVNGDIRQDGSLDDMHFKVGQILESITQSVMLYPGDIVITGTPSGIGPIEPGDEVAVEIDGIGALVNPVE